MVVGWKDVSKVKSTGPEFHSQDPVSVSQPPITQTPQDMALQTVLHVHLYTHVYKHNKFKENLPLDNQTGI